MMSSLLSLASVTSLPSDGYLLYLIFVIKALLMNDPGPPDGPVFNRFHLSRNINVRVIVDRKIFFMQRIVSLFGPTSLDQVMQA